MNKNKFYVLSFFAKFVTAIVAFHVLFSVFMPYLCCLTKAFSLYGSKEEDS